MQVRPGDNLGPYELIAPIGAGGMGEVWKAKDPRIGREVAIKVLPVEVLKDRDRLDRFQKEARAAGGLNHPNLLTIYDTGEANGVPYIVMELLEGETLGERLSTSHDSQSSARISIRRVVEWATQMANGLAAAHDAGVVHRDLKPANVFLTRDGRVKILDFGLAKVRAPEVGPDEATMARETDPGVVMGTVAYMSPEQIRGQQVDQRSDIFALGLILYEILAGRRPFVRETRAEMMTAILKEDAPPLESVAPHVLPSLARIVEHCLEKTPEQRFQTARDLAFNLESVMGSTGSAIVPTSGWKRTFGLGFVGASLVAGLMVGFAIGRFSAPATKPAEPSLAQLTSTKPLTFSGRDQGPAISPDGSLIAFESGRDVRSRIWLKQISGGGELVLTDGPDYTPRFSPDGGTLLFVRNDRADHFSVYRIPILGGETRKIIDDAWQADWSPDGREIAFVRLSTKEGRVDSSLRIAKADGSQEVEIFHINGRSLVAPRWSPDGRRVAVTDGTFGNYAQAPLIVNRDDGESTRLVIEDAGNVYSAVTWVDDNRVILAAVPGGTNVVSGSGSIVQLVDLRTNISTPLFHVPAPVLSVDLDRLGRVVFDAVPLRQNLREVDLETGAPIRWLTRGQAIDRQPAYSHDGSSIIFSSNMTGNLDLSVASVNDRSIRRLTDDEADDFDPAFTPDGKKIVWSSKRETGHYEIWLADADGSGARRISDDGVDAENPTATPDGEWIVYNSYHPTKAGLWKVRSDGSDAQQIVSGSTQLPQVSRDGNWVSYIDADGWLAVAPIERGSPQQLSQLSAQLSPSTLMGRSRWTPDRSRVVFVDRDETDAPTLVIQDFQPGVDTSSTRRVLLNSSDGEIESFDISPDGRRLVVSYLDPLSSVSISEPIALIRDAGEVK